jgi:DNA processing protein
VDPASEAAALVALLRAGRRPWNVYADLVEDAGSALPILEHEQGLLTGQLLESAAGDTASWTAQGMRLLTVLDRTYPENLRAVHDRPPLIFVAGALEPGDARSVAVIGTRKPTLAGAALSRAIARQLVDSGYAVVSGLASGIDTAAHTAALGGGGRTLAVIGTGLRRSYPAENAELQRRIADECAVISQFWPDAAPRPRSFPLRNAVMSGMALATVVVEATQTSGARTQARLALAHGRPVLLVDLLLEQQWARELAARPGTHVIDSPAEVTATVERLTSADTLVA